MTTIQDHLRRAEYHAGYPNRRAAVAAHLEAQGFSPDDIGMIVDYAIRVLERPGAGLAKWLQDGDHLKALLEDLRFAAQHKAAETAQYNAPRNQPHSGVSYEEAKALNSGQIA